jgi:hypothetical protein
MAPAPIVLYTASELCYSLTLSAVTSKAASKVDKWNPTAPIRLEQINVTTHNSYARMDERPPDKLLALCLEEDLGSGMERYYCSDWRLLVLACTLVIK